MAPSQKKKNIIALHESAANLGLANSVSTAGHRREKCDFARPCNPRIRAHVALVDRAAHDVWIFESIGVALALTCEPSYQIADRRDACGRINILFGFADALTHPGEIANLHTSSCVR